MEESCGRMGRLSRKTAKEGSITGGKNEEGRRTERPPRLKGNGVGRNNGRSNFRQTE